MPASPSIRASCSPALTLGVWSARSRPRRCCPSMLIGRVGMNPTVRSRHARQTGSYFLGLTARKLMNRIGAERLVLPGLAVAAVGATERSSSNTWSTQAGRR